ncbi:hypothetical protein [Sulfurimonas sp.]|uniref:hypothetical protein n=1 Tax=Sulfurimonas sp. TaxID=2022749 RepID=UPI002B4A0FB6|nr:hypothetical protein [Sulfurimonas sp.]
MNLVSNTKTIIFDDDPKEIKNLRDALDKLLIQSIYVNFGDPELDERTDADKLTNVRFIFADILLGTKKESNSAIAVEPVISSIINNVSKDNGIFILILWSKDIVEHKTELTRALREDENYKFIEITHIEKNDYIEKEGNPPVKTIDDLIEIIKEKLKDEKYFTLLREWESDTQKSTSQVFNLFFDTEDRTRDYINGAIKSVISGKEEPTILDKKKALWTSMNSIMSDTIEKSIGSDEGTNQLNNDVLEGLDLKILDKDNISSLNSKLLFEIPTSDDVKLYPGNIFCFTSYLSLCDKLKEKVCGYEDYNTYFSDDIFEYSKKNTCMTKNSGEESDIFQVRVKDKLLENMKPILLEFTPYCDYSNDKIRKSRLIFGYLVPSDNKCIKNADYLYKSPFSFVYNEISYILVLSLRHIFGVNPEILNDFTLLFRARKELVNDIQHTIAHHISRVGVSSL